MEQTLVFIKPDAVKRGLVGTILNRFEKRGIIVRELKQLTLNEDMVTKHYQEHADKPFFPDLKTYIMSGPIVMMVLEAENVIKIVRKMVGATNAAEAEPGTIRGDFALNTAHNLIHASDSQDSATREISLFFS